MRQLWPTAWQKPLQNIFQPYSVSFDVPYIRMILVAQNTLLIMQFFLAQAGSYTNAGGLGNFQQR